MAKPTLTSSQIAAIQLEVTNKTTQQTALQDTAALQDPVITNKQEVDNAFGALFNYYNTDIIGPYDDERKAISGVFVISPVTESDILAVGGNPSSGRLVPTPPATDIVRINEFDAGGYTGTTLLNEQEHISEQATAEDQLKNGISGNSPTVNASTLTDSALTAASVSLDIKDTVAQPSFSINDVFLVVNGGSDVAVVQVDSVVDNTAIPSMPPFLFTLGITILIPPIGTIAIGSNLSNSFSGFTNGERISKIASDSNLQPLMNSLITQLETAMQARQSRIAEMLAALAVNDDPDGVAQINTATTNANTADSFITAYLIGTDVSDTGLASLSTERGTRTTELSARLAEILANYTGQTENYYDSRYNAANDRGSTSRGTLRELENAKSVKTDMQGLADGLQNSINSLNGILP